jgi:hypothetical protein
MSNHQEPDTSADEYATPPVDVSLLLRAHAEQRWLSREVIPVLREVETGERLPEGQLSAALSYLEVIWCEAQCRARETDGARALLSDDGCAYAQDEALSAKARSYHAAVVTLREVVRWRVTPLVVTVPVDAEDRTHVRY